MVLIPVAATLQGSSAAPVRGQASESVTVTVGTAFAFSPSSFEVTPGDTITLTVENLDSAQHTFTLSSVTNYSFTSSNTTTDLANFFTAHPPLVYVNVNATPGWKQTVTFTAPRLGTYEYVCEVPGHFQAGMWGLMGSGVSVGPPPGPGLPFGLYIIAGVIVILVVVAIVLGFVVGKREGAKYEMPPERLGYPEPSPSNPPSGPGSPPH